MTRLAQSTSCQHCWLMCTDNFIPPPLTPALFFLFFNVAFYFLSSCQPVTCYLSAWSKLSALWLLVLECGSYLKSSVFVCVCVWQDIIRMNVFMAHCTGIAARTAQSIHMHSHTDYVTSALLDPLPSSTLSTASAVAGTQTLPLQSPSLLPWSKSVLFQ